MAGGGGQVPSDVSEPVAEQRRQLVILASALVLAMSTWFSTAAVLGQLRHDWHLSDTAGAWLTIVVQIGFVAGAGVSSVTNLADRIPPRRLLLVGAVGAAATNAMVVLGDSFTIAVVARFATGAFLAAVYPPSLKAMSSWFRIGRGLALGVMIGALTVGSALPHLLNALGGFSWKPTLLIASGLTVVGGVVAETLGRDGPFISKSSAFDPAQIRAILAEPRFRLASAGYFGHMWELYAMWAWIAAFYGDVFESTRAASLVAFAVIAVGAAGSVHAGFISDRLGRADAAALALRWSASVAVVIGFLVDAPLPIVVGVGLVWGYWVVADSAQFSTIVTEVTDTRYLGTALTLQLAIGFALTVFTIFLVPVVRDELGWGWAFFLLAPGPLLGAWAMRRLRLMPPLPVEEEPAVFVSPFF
ncbi:MAG: MFS transporter [Actinomycetia bacterium]|nr:MFS transporter [Actinomycetes bacterium]MCP5030600.1 MFS transporter [Actinomycetes bacterium]